MKAQSITEWSPQNQQFYADFRQWLYDGGYGDSSRKLYSIAVRFALGFLDKPHTEITDADLEQAWAHVGACYESEGTRSTYRKGLAKLKEYLHQRRGRWLQKRPINWDRYVGPLPDWLADNVRQYIAACQRAWIPERQHRATIEALCHLTIFLRWAATNETLTDVGDLTPDLWFDYVGARMNEGIKPATFNRELWDLQSFLRFLEEAGHPVCRRMFLIASLKTGDPLPRYVPIDQLQRLLAAVEAEAASSREATRRMGILDHAWVLIMLHCGLRVGEVRYLRLPHLDLGARKIRIDQAKGLKDRVVYLSPDALKALTTYLEIRGPADTDHVFVYRHRPLSPRYCNNRLHTYGRRCDVYVTPHMLRHSCATLLLNAGAPAVTVQSILGHERLQTTLRYGRLQDSTVASDYYRAMSGVEGRMALYKTDDTAPHPGELLALVDSLSTGTLNEAQKETMQVLRLGIMALVEHQVAVG